jgi:probable phosphoglycerate mutase
MARGLKARLSKFQVSTILTSPSQRARRTCELAGFGDRAQIEPDLAEWDYGQLEGKRTAEIRQTYPDWQLFRDGGIGGESVTNISARADRVVAKLRALGADVMCFSSGHISRVIAARWLGMEVVFGKKLTLDTASISVLGYEHDLANPAILLWNQTD